jgi:hypothetical protein
MPSVTVVALGLVGDMELLRRKAIARQQARALRRHSVDEPLHVDLRGTTYLAGLRRVGGGGSVPQNAALCA